MNIVCFLIPSRVVFYFFFHSQLLWNFKWSKDKVRNNNRSRKRYKTLILCKETWNSTRLSFFYSLAKAVIILVTNISFQAQNATFCVTQHRNQSLIFPSGVFNEVPTSFIHNTVEPCSTDNCFVCPNESSRKLTC